MDLFDLSNTRPLVSVDQIASGLQLYESRFRCEGDAFAVHFGSTCNGSYGDYSDIDLLIIGDGYSPYIDKNFYFLEGFRFDVARLHIDHAAEVLSKEMALGRTFLASALLEGTCIWGDRDAFSSLRACAQADTAVSAVPTRTLSLWQRSLLALAFNIQKDSPDAAFFRAVSAFELLFRAYSAVRRSPPDKGYFGRALPHLKERDPLLKFLSGAAVGDKSALTQFILGLHQDLGAMRYAETGE